MVIIEIFPERTWYCDSENDIEIMYRYKVFLEIPFFIPLYTITSVNKSEDFCNLWEYLHKDFQLRNEYLNTLYKI